MLVVSTQIEKRGISMTTPPDISHDRRTPQLLLELGFHPKLLGFQQLWAAIDLYALGNIQSMAKDLYPIVSEMTDSTPTAVEHTIRRSVKYAWNRRDPEVWARYFRDTEKKPSNKEFIAVLSIWK